VEAARDFVIRIATVNGTGSASANAILVKSLFRMGVKVACKNLFPSNIQGMPTYYDIRVSPEGWQGPKEKADILVAFNRNTFAKDITTVRPGGYVLYDATAPLPEAWRSEDKTYLPLPVREIVSAIPGAQKTTSQLPNLVYAGCMAAIIGIDYEILQALIVERYRDKKRLEANVLSLQKGFEHGQSWGTLPLRVTKEHRSFNPQESILVDGNYAAALGCLYAGATVVGWYPITPSTSLVQNFESLCHKYRRGDGGKRYAVMQAEDEMAALGIVIGAQWNGARAFTATSGPGLSLMNEFLGYAYYAELPLVLFDVQRAGPATGLPTKTQQSDITLAAYASHGDTKHILLFPGDPQECFQMAADAFDFAERFQTPVLVLSDLNLGMNEFVTPAFVWDEKRTWDRGKMIRSAEGAPKPYYRYADNDGDGIPYRSLPGLSSALAYFTRGSGHDALGRYTEDPKAYAEVMHRIEKKFVTATHALPQPVHKKRGKSHCLVYFGSTEEVMPEVDALTKENYDLLRIRSFPFAETVQTLLQSYDALTVIEQNRDGQMTRLLVSELSLEPKKVRTLAFFDGDPLMAARVFKAL
jgi:2-oxoglutarate ferredoxin oxidoreductase subunit alpha